MNPIAFDFTLIVQMISFLIFSIFICGIIYFFVFARRKQKQDKEIEAKINHIVDLLENDKKKILEEKDHEG